MSFAAWNVRGLNSPEKQTEIRKLINEHSLHLLAILETKIQEANVTAVHMKIAPSWKLFHNYPHSPLGRIWILYNPKVLTVHRMSDGAQHIHCSVTSIDDQKHFYISVVYAYNTALQRRRLWSDMVVLASLMCQSPWSIMGDFNIMRHFRETFGGSGRWNSGIIEFNECIHSAELSDLRYSVIRFTWTNKSPGVANITRKLDRGFYVMICGHPHFLFPAVVMKLKMLKCKLKQLNNKEFSDLSNRVLAAKDELQKCQVRLDDDPSNEGKARVNWLKDGDQNTLFFLKTFNNKCNRKKISRLTLASREITDSILVIKDEALRFFQAILGNNTGPYFGSSPLMKTIASPSLSPLLLISLASHLWRTSNSVSSL
ncbi:uncharacterized protein LOC132300985 [Cornus florida]|uniref:uncharacterized protein LOC132300985 n=1 Tax=Cornus florida TaxID=4283 RepID=UPI00289C204F|nr:uncharacterized protein LOC132300985 [Cornus florida]